MRPVLEGILRYDGLSDGTYDLEDVLIANDALDVRDENNRRMNDPKRKDEGVIWEAGK